MSALAGLLVLSACNEKKPSVIDVTPPPAETTATVDAGPIDPSQCLACQNLAAQTNWSFQGIFRDAKCTEPLAQIVFPACAPVPALGDATVTYAEALGSRKANETVTVALAEQVSPQLPRYRKAGKDCIRADEGAVALTPFGCAGQKVCRDESGSLACTGCRTLSNGCPDFEETRMYALLPDKATPQAAAGGSNQLAQLRQCCTALAAEAKRLGSSPEAGVLASAAAQCTALAASGAGGTSPELGALRSLLAGRKVPPICAGL